jgi:phytoene/squalene synthetase
MKPNHSLAREMTRSASKQTYWTIRLLVDRERVEDAYRAYAYFRWVDDWLDQPSRSRAECSDFIHRQQALLDACIHDTPAPVNFPEETLLRDLVRDFRGKRDGLVSYLENMMGVMAFDAGRRGRLITRVELEDYTRMLALAVTDAMHAFIGHDCTPPQDETRLQAVSAAHITHMLRDTLEDLQTGYFNIPSEFLDEHRITPFDVQSPAYRLWVRERVKQARTFFATGHKYMLRVPSLRCRLAGFAYMARFEGILDVINQEDYLLRQSSELVQKREKAWQRDWSVVISLFTARPLPQTAEASSLEKNR